jgi:ABC-type branched-subunit amino acid transport system ATPase component
MLIQSIAARNFKSLVDFKLDLAKFTCLIGLNGSGKSTVLQFVDFLAQQVRGNVSGWLEERHWRPNELRSGLTTRKNIDFTLTFLQSSTKSNGWWMGSFNTSLLHCTYESFLASPWSLLVKDGHLRISDLRELVPNRARSRTLDPKEKMWKRDEAISFSYEGSILSQYRSEVLPPSLLKLKNDLLKIKSLELLSPEHLRQRTREASGALGLGGQRLSAFLHEIGAPKRRNLTKELQKAYRQLEAVDTTSLRSGWKQLEIREAFNRHKLATEARHVNDGMLRLMAILSELQSDHQLVLFDEIENGINPELVEFVIGSLMKTEKQVVVTTHSPLILNYLDDAVAKAGVIYLYKTREGHTKAIPFFSIPSLAEKLTVMGPGEAFADTDLTRLQDEIAALKSPS